MLYNDYVFTEATNYGLGLCGRRGEQVNCVVEASCVPYPILAASSGMAIAPTSPPSLGPTERNRTSSAVQYLHHQGKVEACHAYGFS